MEPTYKSDDGYVTLYNNDCFDVMKEMEDESVDCCIVDAPYFLSGDGITCKNGTMAKVTKGKWDAKRSPQEMHEFNMKWLEQCRRLLKKDGCIWAFGSFHNIFSVGFAMQSLEYKILNEVTWIKTCPPPNLCCKYLTHATENIVWAAKSDESKYTFHYKEMKAQNGNKQLRSDWYFGPPKKAEKLNGKHPTQKSRAVLDRIIQASTNEGDLILDCFCGSGSTGVSSVKLNRRFVGIEKELEYFELAKKNLSII